MNTITNNIRFGGLMFVATVLVAFGAALVPVAHAADLGLGSYTDSIDYSTPADYSSGYPSYTDSIDYSTPADYSSGYSSYTGSIDYSTPASYYSTPSSYYSGSGYFGGSSGFGYAGMGFGGGSTNTYAPTTVTDNGNTSVYAPTQTNTCTAGNSCNTVVSTPTTVTIDNAGSGGSYPVYTPVYQPTYTPPCGSCNCYGPCAVNTVIPSAPIYPAPAPYVSLTAVPYTGLDLGPVGTVLYWSFLILWCLAAAYLIVVKRIQNKVVSSLNHFLFGVSHKAPAPGSTAHTHSFNSRVAHTVHAQQEDAIDPFIASQINRA